MQKDQLLNRRRALLAGAATLGAAGIAAALAPGAGNRGATASPPAAGAPPARRPLRPSEYRLRPLTGYGPPRTTPGRTPVREEPLLKVPDNGRTVVLTFDDGPDPRYTPRILDTLARYEVRAMFFVCGEMAEYNPHLLARMADEGHVVGNHTWTHPLLTKLRRRTIRSEMERTSDVVEKHYGSRPEWFRAPYGAWNRATFELGAELGMEPLAWTVDTLDWTEPGTRTIVGRVEDGAAPGVVVLSHDAGGDRSQSVKALRSYLPFLLDSGYHVTVPRREYV
ncbi:polysaccharide deacetylase family protein [Streptomyces cellulosae]|uniref:Peptidoglycan/xylan/chitin deacetylase (PgdA/CDA1 family) n=1 Tax=Streptomyces thermodiastaticus TaxID=44061 RepID=A0ABU0KQ10_9ACTN|nr:peptidoglycan/xylan/chitin deacetylase (PgdA/CDA1 family) [Streptomyces thermodiastaticus]UVT13133.1 polysaccharide deacetylase family protein [Streptomyces thermocarboxydus]WSB44963.1 polysaccharide deacetylase family protein [Streptomyces cellulosae]WSB94728.1 polysaccharide deacetylase family protein [Streptomyces cellulosae]WTF23969.1 polysaccharide deacetylase family protein [Streptomyces cellulosae]